MSIQKKMGDLLLNGATMLDNYCPKCKNILFKLPNKEIYCPSCNSEVKIINPSKEEKIKDSRENNKNLIGDLQLNSEEIKNSLKYTFITLIKKLNQSEDILSIERILVNIEKILSILNKLEE